MPLPPEARWLLWQWSQRIGLDQSIACHALTICQRLGITSQQWTRIFGMLKESGVMVTRRVPQQRGRPLTEYRIAAQVQYELANLAYTNMFHRREIELVLNGKALPYSETEANSQSRDLSANLLSAKSRKSRLTLANRWLIAVLLANAETPGRVSGLSYTRLGHLTGMSRNQLQSQIGKLLEQGILAQHQPGRLGHFFGNQMTSIFLFNVEHHLFSQDNHMSIVLWLLSPGEPNRSIVGGLVEALFVAAYLHQLKEAKTVGGVVGGKRITRVDQVAKSFLPNAFDPEPLSKRLFGAYEAGFANWLLVRLQGYAEQLLSHDWETLSTEQESTHHPVSCVMNAIERDFPESSDQNVNLYDAPDDLVGETLRNESSQSESVREVGNAYAPHVTSLYTLAHHLAVNIYQHLEEVENKQFHEGLRDLSYCLTPIEVKGSVHLKVQGHRQRGSDDQPPVVLIPPSDHLNSNMATWLNHCCASVDPCTPERLPRKRFGRRFYPNFK
jgi:hypothetical protein